MKSHGQIGAGDVTDDSSSAADDLHTHTQTLLTLSLAFFHLRDMIRLGDGPEIIRLYKFMMVWCKAVNYNNYSNGLLETIYQSLILPPRLSQSLVWNRSVNLRGNPDSNMPLDLHLEHLNGYFKGDLTSYRGVYTDARLMRISASCRTLKMIADSFDKQTKTFRKTGAHQKPDNTAQIDQLITVLRPLKPFSTIPGREAATLTHEHVYKVQRTELNQWVKAKVSILRTKHYYLHARGEKSHK